MRVTLVGQLTATKPTDDLQKEMDEAAEAFGGPNLVSFEKGKDFTFAIVMED